MIKSSLALFGGPPVRKTPYPLHQTLVDDAEEKELVKVLREGHWSGFSGRAGDRFLGGPKVRELEDSFANYFGVRHAVSFNSATSALHAAIAASGIGPGDEVITSPYTMSATASSILMQNAIPIFADIEDQTYGLDPQSVLSRITPFTKAILTVNLFGHPSRLVELEQLAKQRGLILIEDNAQSPGARYRGRLAGTIGQIGVQSLNYHKAIQTGEGGMALTNAPQLALRMQLIRNHGEVVAADIGQEEWPFQLGWNYRLTELQAAIGIPQLAKLDRFNEIRRKLASLLTQGLKEFDFLTPPIVEEGATHSYYLCPIRYHAKKLGIPRSLFAKAMTAEGISLAEGYGKPLYLHPIYQKRAAYGPMGCPFTCGHYKGEAHYEKGLCPVVERLYTEEMLITDICKYPNSEREVEEFIHAVGKIQHHIEALRRAA